MRNRLLPPARHNRAWALPTLLPGAVLPATEADSVSKRRRIKWRTGSGGYELGSDRPPLDKLPPPRDPGPVAGAKLKSDWTDHIERVERIKLEPDEKLAVILREGSWSIDHVALFRRKIAEQLDLDVDRVLVFVGAERLQVVSTEEGVSS